MPCRRRQSEALSAVLMGLAISFVLAPLAQGAFRGHNGRLAYEVVTGCCSEGAPRYEEDIWTVSTSGRGARRLISGESPTFSPSGRQLAFSRDGDVWLMDADGSRRRRVLSGGREASYLNPAWSPGGAKLAVARCSDLPPPPCEIYIVRRNGTGARLLGEGHAPAWSRRGEIAFGRSDGLYVINSDGTGLRRLVQMAPTGSSDGFEHDWSPDGRKLAFERRDRLLRTRLFIVNRSGSGLRPLLPAGKRAGGEPAWSPDGRKIAFVRGGLFAGLWVVNHNGIGARPLRQADEHEPGSVDGPYLEDPDWQPLMR